MDDLKNSISRLLDAHKIYSDTQRYVFIKNVIKDLFNKMNAEDRDKLRLLLFDEGIKRLAGI